MKLTLLVLAAGMGSRYGGLKQLDEVGPSGETVMDYSVFDAMRAGFDRVVFVIRKDIEEAFRAAIGSRYADRIEVAYAFQDMNDLPAGFRVPEGRTKPWGTGQAVYAARKLLDGPFAVINADDFYGADSYRKLAGYLKSAPEDGKIRGCIASFVLSNTLSENGSVSRGICSADAAGNLSKVVENTKIFRRDGKVISVQEDGAELEFTGEELVSMNSWGFMPELVGELERLFTGFLEEHGTELKSEFYLPFAVDTLIREGRAEIKMLKSEDSWFGITYREDKPFVQAALRKLVAEGAYPEKLFK
ncbi:nucleotidyltransferase family protein [Victivallis lenta]|uniref:nucleotidyltransferase family protein n=1 Tax=Victivallis lenta TaxID=2606640 RepID=UPI000D036D6B|nr:sugar phosphate nucleotidyltransferase [Victivallis lenta]AVM44451.1 nucleotidyltransferase [Victivallales bacterium CCUG 44730]MBS5530269.1 NTP transferase domain-containing protein [bacterium]HBP05305.1 nucleotidyltransferase [Lentisphaeria bacterium]HCH86406.1 nucleotidyltransferase [Lentisphaeria bacterium]